jgi:hypothetical protein
MAVLTELYSWGFGFWAAIFKNDEEKRPRKSSVDRRPTWIITNQGIDFETVERI